MLKYPCLVLDHDDTVVRSEETVNFPFFLSYLHRVRSNESITLAEYIDYCCRRGYMALCRERFSFTEGEIQEEYELWKEHIRTHIPEPYPGIREILHRQRALGGKIYVVSQSSRENILRDYRTHFRLEPDGIYGWDLPPEQRKPAPFALGDIMARTGFGPEQILMVDDMKPAREMTAQFGIPLAFAGWSRAAYPEIFRLMASISDFSFSSTEEFYRFLFT